METVVSTRDVTNEPTNVALSPLSSLSQSVTDDPPALLPVAEEEIIQAGVAATPSLRSIIVSQIIQPEYIKSIKKKFSGKSCWNGVMEACKILNVVLTAGSGVFSFVSVYYQNVMFSFLGGACAVVSAAFATFAMNSEKQIKENEIECNSLLKKLKIEDIIFGEEGTANRSV